MPAWDSARPNLLQGGRSGDDGGSGGQWEQVAGHRGTPGLPTSSRRSDGHAQSDAPGRRRHGTGHAVGRSTLPRCKSAGPGLCRRVRLGGQTYVRQRVCGWQPSKSLRFEFEHGACAGLTACPAPGMIMEHLHPQLPHPPYDLWSMSFCGPSLAPLAPRAGEPFVAHAQAPLPTPNYSVSMSQVQAGGFQL